MKYSNDIANLGISEAKFWDFFLDSGRAYAIYSCHGDLDIAQDILDSVSFWQYYSNCFRQIDEIFFGSDLNSEAMNEHNWRESHKPQYVRGTIPTHVYKEANRIGHRKYFENRNKIKDADQL